MLSKADRSWYPATGLPITAASLRFNLSFDGVGAGEKVRFPNDRNVNGRIVQLVATYVNSQAVVNDDLGVNGVLSQTDMKNVLFYIFDTAGNLVVDGVTAERFNTFNVWRRLFFAGFRIDMERSYITTYDPNIVNKQVFVPVELGYL